ncbi:MAG TPA: hypothetical protein VMZ03_14515 [Chitinophagaceae bacterium]|nr:hypothetical protein [Chitinophagaceae bacterium]
MQLTQWNYTQEEWRNFLHWKTRKKGVIFFLLCHLRPVRTAHVPEIRIADDRVWINNSHEPFQNSQRQFRDINIRETGKFNILEISYEQSNKLGDIRVPIPRGKLREALEVQERLIMNSISIG